SSEDQVILREAYKDRPLSQDRSSLTGRVLLESRSVQILDTQTDPDYGEQARETARRNNDRTMLGVPLVRSGTMVGIIVLRRKHVAAFTPSEVSLARLFPGLPERAMG